MASKVVRGEESSYSNSETMSGKNVQSKRAVKFVSDVRTRSQKKAGSSKQATLTSKPSVEQDDSSQDKSVGSSHGVRPTLSTRAVRTTDGEKGVGREKHSAHPSPDVDDMTCSPSDVHDTHDKDDRVLQAGNVGTVGSSVGDRGGSMQPSDTAPHVENNVTCVASPPSAGTVSVSDNVVHTEARSQPDEMVASPASVQNCGAVPTTLR